MESYTTYKLENGKYILCKILNEYDTRKEADKDMVYVATKKITETELLRIYNENLKTRWK